MGLIYKIDILNALKANGYNTYRIKQERLLSESTVQKLRNREPLAWKNIETLCKLLNSQPSDLLEYVPDDSETTTGS